MSSEQDIDFIESFLQDNLSASDKSRFEERLRSDKQFKFLFNEEQALYKAVKNKQGQAFQNTINNIIVNKRKSLKILSIKKYAWIISIAASVLILIFVSVGERKKISPEKLFDTYYETYPMILSNRGKSELEESMLINAYRNKNWETVQNIIAGSNFESLPLPLKDLYQAISLLERSDAEAAIEILSPYTSQPVSQLYQHNIEWYLALSHLKNNNIVKAKDLLSSLKEKENPETSLGKKIAQLLKEL